MAVVQTQTLKRLLIADASSLIFRGSSITAKDPQYKGGWSYLCRKMFNKIKQIKPTHCIIAGDGYNSNDTRREIQKDYKAFRPQCSDIIKYQLSNIDKLLDILKIPFISQELHEADDIINTFVNQAINRDFEEVHIIADDKDLFTLLSNSRVAIHRLSNKSIDINPIRVINPHKDVIPVKNYNVLPSQIPDFLALVGDTVDNIQGCPGVGFKRAQQLLTQYQNIDGIFNNITKIAKKQKAIANNLRDNEELIRRGLSLTKLKDLSNIIPKNIDHCIFDIDWIDKETTKNKLEEIGLHLLYTEIDKAKKEMTSEKSGFFQLKDS